MDYWDALYVSLIHKDLLIMEDIPEKYQRNVQEILEEEALVAEVLNEEEE